MANLGRWHGLSRSRSFAVNHGPFKVWEHNALEDTLHVVLLLAELEACITVTLYLRNVKVRKLSVCHWLVCYIFVVSHPLASPGTCAGCTARTNFTPSYLHSRSYKGIQSSKTMLVFFFSSQSVRSSYVYWAMIVQTKSWIGLARRTQLS